MKKNISHPGISKKLKLIFVLLLFAVVLILGGIYSKHFDLSYAKETINFSQKILPFNPVEGDEKIEKREDDQSGQEKKIKYRIISPVSKDQAENLSVQNEEVFKKQISPIVTFKGFAAYPNAPVMLEIHSKSFFVSLMSGENGEWSWTNYGKPLENGAHSLEVYSISPYETVGKKDVFAEKYLFNVSDGIKNSANVDIVDIENFFDKSYVENIGDQDLGDRFLSGDPMDTYFFVANILKNKTYDQSENVNVEMVFSSFGKVLEKEVEIDYEVYAESENGQQGDVVFSDSDKVTIQEEEAFIKKLILKDRLVDGKYILKISAKVGEDEYVQVQHFSTTSKKMVQIGNTVITEEAFNQALLLNILGVLFIVLIIIIVLLIEYRRISNNKGQLDEDILGKTGYFSK